MNSSKYDTDPRELREQDINSYRDYLPRREIIRLKEEADRILGKLDEEAPHA